MRKVIDGWVTTAPENSPISRLCLYVERSGFYSAEIREVTVRFRANVEHWCLDENGETASLLHLTGYYESLQEMGIDDSLDPEWNPSLEDEKIELDRSEGQEVVYIERRSIRLAKVLNNKEIQRLFGERSKVQEAIKRLGEGADLERRERYYSDVLSKFWIWYEDSGFTFPEPSTRLSTEAPKTKGRPPIMPEQALVVFTGLQNFVSDKARKRMSFKSSNKMSVCKFVGRYIKEREQVELKEDGVKARIITSIQYARDYLGIPFEDRSPTNTPYLFRNEEHISKAVARLIPDESKSSSE